MAVQVAATLPRIGRGPTGEVDAIRRYAALPLRPLPLNPVSVHINAYRMICPQFFALDRDALQAVGKLIRCALGHGMLSLLWHSPLDLYHPYAACGGDYPCRQVGQASNAHGAGQSRLPGDDTMPAVQLIATAAAGIEAGGRQGTKGSGVR